MPSDLAVLAEAGAAVLIGVMATERWQETRAAVVLLLAAGDELAGRAMMQQMDATCATLVGLPHRSEERRALAIGLRMMLSARLEHRPERAAELRRIFERARLGGEHPAPVASG